MTNFARWQLFMRDVTSPQSFIDFGFYYIIAAALQRRVWTGPEQRKLYPNLYIVLVGEPGIGKGLVIKPVTKILKYHTISLPGEQDELDTVMTPESNTEAVDPQLVEALQRANISNATMQNPSRRKPLPKKPLVIPVAADSTTYEALLQDLARATRSINYKQWNEKLKRNTIGIYVHASLCFSLEEISSLFAKHTENVVNCLLKLYDCGDYDRITKTQGCDHVMNTCLNLLGGTTPGFMQSVFNDKLLSEGFSSRAWFVYETVNRFNTLMAPELSAEQLECEDALIKHVGQLTKLYGQVKFEDDAWAYLEHWWKEIHPLSKPNTSLKLIPYYARKNIHAQKLAIVMHFAEYCPPSEIIQDPTRWQKISLETTKRAMARLDQLELKMHYAINFDNKNPLFRVGQDITKFIKQNGPQDWKSLLAEFWDDARGHEFKEIMEHLLTVRKVFQCAGEKGKPLMYDIPRQMNLATAGEMPEEPKPSTL